MSQQFSGLYVPASSDETCAVCGYDIAQGTIVFAPISIGSNGLPYSRAVCQVCEPVALEILDTSAAQDPFWNEWVSEYVEGVLVDSLTPPGFMVTWWRHVWDGYPLPVVELLATEGVDL